MDADRLAQIQEIFSRALELPVGERAEYIKTACGDDINLREAVERYLRADSAAEFSLIDRPIASIRDLDGLAQSFSFHAGQKIGNYEVKTAVGRRRHGQGISRPRSSTRQRCCR